MNELKRIAKLYQYGKLSDDYDEKLSGGYWDLAGKIANSLVGEQKHFSDEVLFEQLQTGIYQVFQKLLVKKEFFD